MTVELPAGLLALPDADPTWRPWLAGLPRLAQDLLDEWSLRPDGAPMHGRCALVVPVRTDADEPAVLKLTWPHWEAEHEPLALQHWHGRGAVELLRADPHRCALLLERLDTTDLMSLDPIEACGVVADLYGRLHRPAVPRLRTLSSVVAGWAGRLRDLPRDAALPRRLVDQAVHLAGDLVTDPRTDEVMIHTDLHYENVLRGGRAPWLAIDPKPLAGDPHYEVAPLLWSRWDEVTASGDVRGAVRRRLDVVVERAGLGHERARDWVVVREMCNALWVLEDLRAADRAPGAAERAALTQAVAIAKAVQD